jgi:hypothetical protein
MRATLDATEGIYLRNLDPGAILDVETKSRHYKIEYVGGDEVLISGHPSLCPAPVSAQLRGSLKSSGEVQPGFLGMGLRLAFRRLNDDLPVITSAVQDIHQEVRPH